MSVPLELCRQEFRAMTVVTGVRKLLYLVVGCVLNRRSLIQLINPAFGLLTLARAKSSEGGKAEANACANDECED